MLIYRESNIEIPIEVEIDHYPSERASHDCPASPSENTINEWRLNGYEMDRLYWIPNSVMKKLKETNPALGSYLANLFTVEDILKDHLQEKEYEILDDLEEDFLRI